MLTPSDLAAIKSLERRWLKCELGRRPWEVLNLCARGVVWLPPGGRPIRGKPAIRAWLGASRDHVEDIRLRKVTVAGDRFAAYRIANFRTRYVPSGSTDAVTMTGWHLWVMRRNADAVWRVSVVAWSLEQPERPRRGK